MKSILNAHPFSNFLAPSPPSLDVPGLAPSSTLTFCRGFSHFCHFGEDFFTAVLHVYLQRMVQNTFLACKLIVHVLSLEHGYNIS